MSDDLLLPEGSVLVHVGPYKTGTTAIQASLHHQRSQLLEHGVVYPGTDRRQFRAEWALTGRRPPGATSVEPQRWTDLVDEVRAAAAKRVCISSEGLSSAGPEAVERLVSELGPDRVHVLMVARRLDKLLPSAWQERVKTSKEARTYEQWLHEVLDSDPDEEPVHGFWRNHGLANLIGRWAPPLPADRVHVLVADESDRSQQLRTFERLLGLPEELLEPGPRDNSSLSYERVELYRRLNEVFDARGWSDVHRRKLIHQGLLDGLRTAPSQPTDVPLPRLAPWAAARVAELSDRRVEELRRSGVHVIGDPERLRLPEVEVSEDLGEPETIAISTVARAVEELVAAALEREQKARESGAERARHRVQERARARAARQAKRWARQRAALEQRVTVDDVSSKQLLRVVARRQRDRLLRRRR